jgi:uncharacterized protein YukE
VTAPGFTVSPNELRNHANVVQQLVNDMEHTIGSAQSAALGSQAFGEIAVALAFANLIKQVASPGVSALSQAQSMLRTINTTISTTARNYDTVEQTNQIRFSPGTGTDGIQGSGSGSLFSSRPTGTVGQRSGANLMNDVSSLEKDISSGSWIQAGLAGMNVISDIGNILSNPVGAIMQFGFGFLMHAIKPLQQAVGWLVGNPGQVTAYGNQWQGVAQQVVQLGHTFSTSLSKDTATWTGATADSYRSYANDKINTLGAVATATRAIGNATQVIGQLVQKVEKIIKDLVSQAMGQIIQTAMSASFMITIPVVVAEVVREVISWMQKIASVIQSLTSAFNTLQPLMSGLAQLFGSTSKSMASGVQPLAAIAHESVPGINLPTPVGRVAPVM